MNFPNLNDFWLGDENSLMAFLKSEEKIHGTPALDLNRLSLDAMSSDASSEYGEYGYMVSRYGDVAVVTVSGSLVRRSSPYNRYFGRVSYDEIRNAVFAAAESSVGAILMNYDTPGGEASGISELSDFMSQVDSGMKPIYTYTGTIMASGGYWLGSSGRQIFAAKMSTVGSIGVVTVHASYAQMLKDAGIEVTVLRAGEFKALGSPYEKLNDKARAQIEGQMNTIYDVFLATVAENRGTSVEALKKNAAEGRIFMGADSVTVGLVDKITSFDDAVAAVSKKVKASSNRAAAQRPFPGTNTGATDMSKRKVLTEAGVAALASGVSEEVLAGDPNMVVDGDDAPNADASAAAGTEGAAAEGSSDPASEQQAAPAASPAQPQADQNLINTMFDRITLLTTQLAETKASLAGVTAERDKAKSSETALIKIAVQAINRMQVSLGGVPSKMDDSDAATVLEQYNRTYSQFNQYFKVGAAAKVPTNKDTVEAGEKPVNSSVEAAATRLTTNRVASH